MNIIVRAPNWVGDCILSTPFLKLLRERRPQAKITVLTHAKAVDVYKGNPHIDDLKLLGSLFGTAMALKKENFEEGYLLPNSFSSALLFFLAGVKRRIGYGSELRGPFLTDALEWEGENEHRAFRYAHLLEPDLTEAQFNVKSYPALLPLPANPRKFFATISGDKLVVLNPGSVHASRRWDANRLGALAEKLTRERGAQIVFAGGASSVELELAEQAMRFSGVGAVNLTGKTTIIELACLLARAKALVTTDSGMMHIASAVGAPMVVLAGASDMKVTCPWSADFIAIDKKAPCSPCVKNVCVNRKEPMICMRSIQVEDVFDAVDRCLNKK